MTTRPADPGPERTLRPDRAGAGGAAGRGGGRLLVVVAGLFVVAQVTAVSLRMPLGWDETVYASQIGARVPAAYFSAPRARGITWLAAPAILVSASTVVLRCWMTFLAGVGLAVAYWPWRRLVGEVATAVAAGLFVSLWVVQFYAGEVMPNLYVAFGAVAAAGWSARAVAGWRSGRGVGFGSAAGAGAAVAFTALMRPPDAVWLVAALSVLALAGAVVGVWGVPAAVVLGAGVVAGVLAGAAPWIRESYERFGGPLERLRVGSDVQGGVGWHVAVGMELRAVNGPMLCRPCTAPWSHPLLTAWWLLTPVAVVVGLVLAYRRRGEPAGWSGASGGWPGAGSPRYRRRRLGPGGVPCRRGGRSGGWRVPSWVRPGVRAGSAGRGGRSRRVLGGRSLGAGGGSVAPGRRPGGGLPGGAFRALLWAVGAATAVAVPYLFLLDYAATRFLMPAYALLALPTAAGLVSVPGRLRPGWPRSVVCGLLGVCLAAHVGSQYVMVRHMAVVQERQRSGLVRLAGRLNALGLRAPCTLVGADVPPLAYHAGCASEALAGNNASITVGRLRARAAREPVAVAQYEGDPPAYARGWARCVFTLADGERWQVFHPATPAGVWRGCGAARG